jgi:hypothetical protein
VRRKDKRERKKKKIWKSHYLLKAEMREQYEREKIRLKIVY